MRFPRFLVTILILALAVTPALAADCATSCAGRDAAMTMGVVNSTSVLSGPCQDMGRGSNQPTSDTPSCPLAAVCHFASSAAILSVPQSLFVPTGVSTRLPSFPVALCADLVPPNKPPA